MAEQAYIPRLKQHYQEVLSKQLAKDFGYANPMQVPRLDKVEDVLGMDIIVCTTARTDDEARALLAGLNFPFRS